MRTGQGYHGITNEAENAGVRVLSVSCPGASGAFFAIPAYCKINNLRVINRRAWFKSTPRNQLNHKVTGNWALAATVQNCPIRGTDTHSSPYLLNGDLLIGRPLQVGRAGDRR